MSVNAVCSSTIPYWLAGFWYLLLFAAGLMPDTPEGPELPHFDKVVHWGAYGVFGVLLFIHRKLPDWFLWVAFILAMVQESTHLGVSERSFEWLDWLANCAGITSGWFVIRRYGKYLGIDEIPQT